MTKKKWHVSVATLAISTLMISGLAAQMKGHEGHVGEDKTFPSDNGPDTIDVSKYPAEQQANYKVFTEKCSKCHTLARPINSPFALPEEWQAYVTKMMRKKRSGIDKDSVKSIVEFLTYDSSVRKKDLIKQKLKEKSAGKTDASVSDREAASGVKDDSGAKDKDSTDDVSSGKPPSKGTRH